MPELQDILTEIVQPSSMLQRRHLIPVWIKVFAWIFLLFGLLIPVIVVMSLLGYNPSLAIYGLETYHSFSFTGLLIISIFTLEAITAFGILKQKDWAIKLAILDAVVGILACTYQMVIAPMLSGNPGFALNVRLELIALIPYLVKAKKIQPQWELAG